VLNQDNIKSWIARSAAALTDFFSDTEKCFVKDNLAFNGSPATGATSSNRAFVASAEFLQYFGEDRPRDRLSKAQYEACREVVQSMCSDYFTRGLSQIRSHSGAEPNMFSDAHVLLALTMSVEQSERAKLETLKSLGENQRAILLALSESMLTFRGGRLGPDEANNELITLNVLRSLEVGARLWGGARGVSAENTPPANLFAQELWQSEFNRWTRGPEPDNVASGQLWTELRTEARSNLLTQLGLYSAQDAEFDPPGLLGATCILQRFGGRSGRQLIVRAIEVLAECQDEDGSWRADVLATTGGRLVYVSSMEMAVALTNLILADLSRGDDSLMPVALPVLNKAFRLLESGYHDLPGSRSSAPGVQRGWSNDRTRRQGTVESWPTAIALQFVMRFNRIATQSEQIQILRNYRTSGSGFSLSRWPDLEPVVPRADRTADGLEMSVRRAMEQASDPSDGSLVRKGITEDIILPILTSPYGRPDRAASFLLYGPPGTRKTSLVRSVSRALGWPLLTVSPADFLVNGIEGLEARAEQIFRDLLRLRRTVILFDECEEFFRRRLQNSSPETRTLGAFITSGMLPRLQDLRDRSWSVFAIVTNTERDELDPAVIRRGRLDKHQRIGHPTLEAQAAYLAAGLTTAERALTRAQQSAIREALISYHDAHIKKPQDELDTHRRNAATVRRSSGNLREYFDEVAKLRSKEAEMPKVTFAVLDSVAAHLRGEIINLKNIRAALEFLANDDGHDQWALVP
jgi:ATPase family associated with various cellular activities (AAA)